LVQKWLGYPSRGVSTLSLTHPKLLNVSIPSKTYYESQISSFINMLYNSKDPLITTIISQQLERESDWTQKESTLHVCNQIVQETSNKSEIITPTNPYINNGKPFDYNIHNKNVEKFKHAAKNEITKIYSKKSPTALNGLSMQGDLIRLVEDELGDIEFLMIRNVPRVLLAFGTRAISNSLASPDNLAKWSKIVNPSCRICGKIPCNLFHILSNCNVSLNQKRYNVRHALILDYLVMIFKENKYENFEVYSDLEGHRVEGGSIPSKLLVTTDKPDIVIVNKTKNNQNVTLVELTCPWDMEENIKKAEKRKCERYSDLVSDLKKTHKTTLITLEIGVRGYIN